VGDEPALFAELLNEIHAAVLDTMLEGVVIADCAGRIMRVNAATARMIGQAAEELEGISVEYLFHERPEGLTLGNRRCELPDAIREGRPVAGQHDFVTRADGSSIPVAYSVAPLRCQGTLHGAVVVFRDTSSERAEQVRLARELDSLTWVGRLRDALQEGRLCLHAQPIVPLAGGEPGEELLLRMQTRGGEEILPTAFLPAAEKYGLIVEIDHWVAAQAVGLAARGRRVFFNLSARTVGDRDLLRLVGRLLDDLGADASRLVFEITETALIHDLDGAADFTRALAGLGCQVALDDFGTGFGSFASLKRLPISYLKIDIEFVRNLPSSRAN